MICPSNSFYINRHHKTSRRQTFSLRRATKEPVNYLTIKDNLEFVFSHLAMNVDLTIDLDPGQAIY